MEMLVDVSGTSTRTAKGQQGDIKRTQMDSKRLNHGLDGGWGT